jgi:hypothetical protein
MALDIENQFDGADLGGIEDNEPLLPKTDRSSNRSSRRNRRSLEVIELDDIPPIIKSANGNIFVSHWGQGASCSKLFPVARPYCLISLETCFKQAMLTLLSLSGLTSNVLVG